MFIFIVGTLQVCYVFAARYFMLKVRWNDMLPLNFSRNKLPTIKSFHSVDTVNQCYMWGFFSVFVQDKHAQTSLNSSIQSLLGLNYENMYFADFMKNPLAFSKFNLLFYNVLWKKQFLNSSVVLRSNIPEGHFTPVWQSE